MRLPRIRHFLKDVPIGARYLVKGFWSLFRHRRWWPILIAPVLINLVIFSAFVVSMGALYRGFLAATVPDSWWGIVLFLVLFVTGVALVLFLSVPLFTVLAALVASPFYDQLAARVSRDGGNVIPESKWTAEFVKGIRQSLFLFGWYVFVQVALVLVLILPIVGGPVSVTVLSFLVGAVFLAIEFVGFSPRFRSWAFPEQRKWCMREKGVLAGFGLAIALALVIPGINLVTPAAAVIGGVKLADERHDGGKRGDHFRKV